MAVGNPKKPRGCLFYGCLVAVVLIVVTGTALILGVHAAKKMINELTDAAPMALAEPNLSPAEIDAAQQKLNTFQNAIRQDRPTEPLVLSAAEINALITTAPAAKQFRDKLRILIEDGQLKAQVSVKLAELGLPFFKNRYLNGVATIDATIHDGSLRVTTKDIRVKGKALPSVYLERIKQENLAKKLNYDPRMGMAFEKIEAIQVDGSQVKVVPKQVR